MAEETDENNNSISKIGGLKELNPRWRNWVTRVLAGIAMISGFSVIVYLGPFVMMVLIFAIESQIYREVVTIGHRIFHADRYLPCFRKFSLFFFILANYFLHGQMFIEKFSVYFKQYALLGCLVDGHSFVSCLAYVVGLLVFLAGLNKACVVEQLTLLGYIHLAMLIFVPSANGLMRALCEGSVWFLLPTAMNIFNDIMAYMFGFFFGRTGLIQVSPKKTWEGFIGAAVSTVLFGQALAAIMIKHKTFTCPLEYNPTGVTLVEDCQLPRVFKADTYVLPLIQTQLSIEPFMIHAFFISAFISIIGPFGGFFASGFKRAVNIKDFGTLIPGHGGVGDRFDCIHIMSYFVYMYHQSFINEPTPNKLLNLALELSSDDQQLFNNMLASHFNRTTEKLNLPV